MSNHDDLDPLAAEQGIHVRFVRSPHELQPADIVVLPGSKHVTSDLHWLKAQGLDTALAQHLRYSGKVLGICGGMQMLGQYIHDDDIEGGSSEGLAYLPLSTQMQHEKIRKQVDTQAAYPQTCRVQGYEIHHGISDNNPELFPFAQCSSDQQVWGTYVHGLFEQGAFRKAWLESVGFQQSDGMPQQVRTLASLDLLADALEAELHPELLSPLMASALHPHQNKP